MEGKQEVVRRGLLIAIEKQREAGIVPALVMPGAKSCCALMLLLGIPHKDVKRWIYQHGRLNN